MLTTNFKCYIPSLLVSISKPSLPSSLSRFVSEKLLDWIGPNSNLNDYDSVASVAVPITRPL